MKKLPTLTIALVLLGAGGFQIASALRADSPQSVSKEKKNSETLQEEPVAKNNTEAVELIRQARNQLFEKQSVQAGISEVVTLGDYKLKMSGSYLSAAGFRYRLEYQVELGDLQGNFLEVCDGQVLHTRRQIGEARPSPTSVTTPEVELSRRDIQKIRREAMGIKETVQGDALADALRAAEIGIGGLPAVLASLERSMNFTGVHPETIDGREFLMVEGSWKKDRQERLLMGLGSARNQVAGFMPDLVRVYLVKETLFPEKFLYLKQTDADSKSYQPLVAIEFLNVTLDQPVPERQFVYVAPPGVEEKDETAAFVEAMRQTAEPPAPAGNK